MRNRDAGDLLFAHDSGGQVYNEVVVDAEVGDVSKIGNPQD